MTTYLTDDFLLHTATARTIYHEYAECMPVFDYHCHLSPRSIAQDETFDTISKLWLDGDHYKWRLMRADGIDEKIITGKASGKDKFIAWAGALSRAVKNPLFDWAHLELKRYFGISNLLLSPSTAERIFAICNEKLREEGFSARNLLRKMNVKVVCTTDDPVDSLAFHRQLREEGFEIQVLPSFRPEKVFAVDNPAVFNAYCDKLSEAAALSITTFDDLIEAIDKRHAYFHENGCRSSDHALESVPAEPFSIAEIEATFTLARLGKTPSKAQCATYASALMLELGRMNHRRGWVQQFHLGVIRNPRSRLFASIGPDAGADCMGDFNLGSSLCRYLDSLDRDDKLTKTILYNINPRDNELLARIAGSFQDGSVAGKMQCGPAWWSMDHADGIARHLKTIATSGLLGRFIGMTTDSRSLLSFVRHEYFRRILCNMLGRDMDSGDIPNDVALIGSMVSDICFNNARDFFDCGFASAQRTKETYEHAAV